MKASNDLVEKYGWDKIIHGLVGLLIVAICVLVAVFCLEISLFRYWLVLLLVQDALTL